MCQLITLARPYAQAAFNFAFEEHKIEKWQNMLSFASEVVRNKEMKRLMTGILGPEALSSFFNLVCGEKIDKNVKNLIKLMAYNERLIALPNVLKIFIQLRDKHENISRLEVICANKISDDQLLKIKLCMQKYLSCKVELNCKLDKLLIAGVIIRIGDFVIDGSFRNRLKRLSNFLQS